MITQLSSKSSYSLSSLMTC